jgi:hypothetical protein
MFLVTAKNDVREAFYFSNHANSEEILINGLTLLNVLFTGESYKKFDINCAFTKFVDVVKILCYRTLFVVCCSSDNWDITFELYEHNIKLSYLVKIDGLSSMLKTTVVPYLLDSFVFSNNETFLEPTQIHLNVSIDGMLCNIFDFGSELLVSNVINDSIFSPIERYITFFNFNHF